MKYQIVVSRYNEDISYLLLLNDILLVYNKGEDNIPIYCNTIKLPNIGRESHTYLYHIVNNYDYLADKTLFIQGKISDHKLLQGKDYFKEDDFIAKINLINIQILKKRVIYSNKYLKELKKSKYTPYEWINKIGLCINELNDFKIVWGANFCVSKKLIHKKPKIFYEDLLKYLEYDKNPEEGHFFERSWYLLFNSYHFNLKQIILYEFIEELDEKLILRCNKLLEDKNIKEIHLWTTNFNNIYNKYNFKTYILNDSLYINIYPFIENNSFKINIIKNVDLLMKFENNIIYDIQFNEQSIKIFKDDILLHHYDQISYEYIEYTIKWLNNTLLFIKDNIVFLYVNDHEDLKFNSIKIKALNKNYFYKTINNSKIYIFYDEIKCNKLFYKDNYEDYYINKLSEYIIEKSFY